MKKEMLVGGVATVAGVALMVAGAKTGNQKIMGVGGLCALYGVAEMSDNKPLKDTFARVVDTIVDRALERQNSQKSWEALPFEGQAKCLTKKYSL